MIYMTPPYERADGSRWCYLVSDSDEVESLHELAAQIGIERKCFESSPVRPRYIMSVSKRLVAIRAGASGISEESYRVLVEGVTFVTLEAVARSHVQRQIKSGWTPKDLKASCSGFGSPVGLQAAIGSFKVQFRDELVRPKRGCMVITDGKTLLFQLNIDRLAYQPLLL